MDRFYSGSRFYFTAGKKAELSPSQITGQSLSCKKSPIIAVSAELLYRWCHLWTTEFPEPTFDMVKVRHYCC